MNKIQKLKFSCVDEFLEYLPPHERQLVEKLRQLVVASIPQVQEKLSYNVPYYARHSRICYIWPAAVPWGKVPANSVVLGFCNGHLLQDEIQYLEKAERKQIRTKVFTDVSEMEEDLLKAYLYEAMEVDQYLWAHREKHQSIG
ncbi:MAG: DUF1801 domain-containing protein [Rufibacter sp.]